MARVAEAADALLDRSSSVGGAEGDALAVVAARVWAGAGSDTDRLRRWAGGDGIPDVLAGDDDFRWKVLRRLASLDAVSDDEVDEAEAADRSLAGSLAAIGVRAVRPTAFGEGVGLGSPARRHRAVELRGPRAGLRVLGDARPRAGAAAVGPRPQTSPTTSHQLSGAKKRS